MNEIDRLKQEQYRLEQKQINYAKVNRLEYYSPYPFQLRFHYDKSKHVSLNAGNKPGKCVTYQTLIDTVSGKQRIGDIFGREIEVLTHPGNKPRKVINWIRKPKTECFRITMADGQWVEVPKGHRILCNDGYACVESIPAFLQSLEATSLGNDRSVRVLDGRHYIQKLLDYLDDYSVDRRLYDGQLLYDLDSAQVFAPSQDDARHSISFWCKMGDLASRYIGSPLLSAYRLSIQYVGRQILAQYEPSVFLASQDGARYMIRSNENMPQSCDFVNLQGLTAVTSTHRYRPSSLGEPVTINGNHIVSVRSIGFKTLYDMEVEDRHNYIAGGLVHHNTECGGADTAYHATGRYPDDWEGPRFDHPIDIIVGGKTNTKVRNLGQHWLLGKPGNMKALGTMFIPKKDIQIDKMIRKPGVPGAWDKVYIKHHTNGIYDGDTEIAFLAYDAEKEAWMGDPADLVWLDEEPPASIFGQATRSVIATGGYIKQTFTPENGRTEVLKVIEDSWSIHNATWMDASGGDFTIELPRRTLEFKTVYGKNGQKGHLTEEKVRDAIKGMLPHEIEMRVLGEPMQGSGLIFSYPQDQVMCEPIEIPDHWPRLAALDFGGISEKSHPSAGGWAAYDEANDTIYIYDCMKVFANKIPDVAARIISRPQWIPMMYPHDGEKTVPGGGTVAQEYRRYGVNMFHTHVTNPDPEKPEGKGGIKIEPQLVDMNSRFADRRLRIFNTLPEIWEELRNFHTTMTAEGKAKIVDRDDDLIAVIRYICAMIRHALKESDVIDQYDDEDYDNYGPQDGTTGYG